MESIFYGALCLALLGFFAWRWWVYRPAPAPAPAVTNTVAIAPVAPPPPVVRRVTPAVSPTEPRPVQNILEAQIALARLGISSGSIDGVAGSQTRAALMAFQKMHALVPNGILSSNTKALLLITPPVMTNYTISTEDLGRLMPLPKTWLEKSEQPRLDFENVLELLGEKAFSHPQLIRSLNPDISWTNLSAGAQVIIPRVEYPPVASRAALIKISLQDCVLEAFDSDANLLVHFPCSIGHVAEKRPTGELHVANIALDPNYTFDPDVFPESAEAQEIGRKLIIPPGPRNPVGVAWIGLDRPGYGIHGTPAPERVGRTESHGCFRLANWNARYLARLAWVGLPVTVE
ncbi:MAG TPA: L,D-transpeptidase [Verrucomicrobiae bacterium]|nr:L,D-transpeptidase [Verrucomicrobiae bacterium]